MTTLWKALQQDNIGIRQSLGSGDPSLTVILGGFLTGEGTESTFSSTLIGSSRTPRNPKKDVILRGQSSGYTGTSSGSGSGGGNNGRRPPQMER